MTDYKSQVLSKINDKVCCKYAFVGSLLFSSGELLDDDDSILVNSSNHILDKLSRMISELYPSIVLCSWDGFLYLSNIGQLKHDMYNGYMVDIDDFANECDRLTILKTLFLTNAKLRYTTDNNKNSTGYTLEFVFADENSLDFTNKLLNEHNFSFSKVKRQSSFILYTKNSNKITDFLVLVGATNEAMNLQNSLVMRELRNNTNRQNNCYESNLDKSITSSTEQLVAIEYIFSHHLEQNLDENLTEIALLRLSNPESTLNELKTLLGNKISRAGIKYRLDKILEIYKSFKENS